jgi:uncharacterized coiled-coil protein SlyX
MGCRFTTVAGMGAIEIETLRQDVQEGRIGADRLLELLASQQRAMEELRRQLRAANERIEEFEKKWGSQPTTIGNRGHPGNRESGIGVRQSGIDWPNREIGGMLD